MRIGRFKLPTPLTNGFMGDGEASFGKKFFHLKKTEAEPMVQPDGLVEKFCREMETVTVIDGYWLCLLPRLPNES